LSDKESGDVVQKSETTTQTIGETMPWLFQPQSKPEMIPNDVTTKMDEMTDDITKIDEIMKHQDSVKSGSTISSSGDLGTEGVNFINIIHLNFLYKHLFGSFPLVTCE